MITRLGKDERELSLTIEEATGMCIAYTTYQKWMTKFKNKKWIILKTEYYDDGSILSMTFKAPENYLSLREYNPNKVKTKRTRKPMSEEHKQKLREARQNKKV